MRTVLEDGRWFDKKKCKAAYEEDTTWNGNNHISCATGSQWDHEKLYLTAGGKWILHAWSQWQGSMPSYREVSTTEAAAWLVRNGHDDPRLAAETGALEVA